MKTTPLVAFTLLASSCATEFDFRSVAGFWQGDVSQPDSELLTNYEIVVEFSGEDELDSVVARVTYPSLECAGTWRLEEHPAGPALVIEQLDDASSACVNNGEVFLIYDEEDEVIGYVWDDDPEKEGSESIASLDRVVE